MCSAGASRNAVSSGTRTGGKRIWTIKNSDSISILSKMREMKSRGNCLLSPKSTISNVWNAKRPICASSTSLISSIGRWIRRSVLILQPTTAEIITGVSLSQTIYWRFFKGQRIFPPLLWRTTSFWWMRRYSAATFHTLSPLRIWGTLQTSRRMSRMWVSWSAPRKRRMPMLIRSTLMLEGKLQPLKPKIVEIQAQLLNKRSLLTLRYRFPS